MDFERWLKNRLIETARDLGLDSVEFDVYKEQEFVRSKDLKPKRIYVCVKHLTPTPIYASKVEPLQITILSEANTLEYSDLIFTKFCQTYNWYQLRDGKTAYKMQFTGPAPMNNFNVVGINFRTILFVSASLIVLENVCDIDSLFLIKDDGTKEKIEFITASLSYGANMDTVQYAGTGTTDDTNGELATSVKTSAALNMAITIASQDTTIVNKALKIMFGLESGNADYKFDLKIGNIEVNNVKLKQQSCVFTTAKTEIPAIQIGFTK